MSAKNTNNNLKKSSKQKKKKEEKNLKNVFKDLSYIFSKNMKEIAKNEKVKKGIKYINKNFNKISCIFFFILIILMLITTIIVQNHYIKNIASIYDGVVQNFEITKQENNLLKEQNQKLLEIIISQR